MRNVSMVVKFFLVGLFLLGSVFVPRAQETQQGENIDLWKRYRPNNTSTILDGVDSLWMGGVFLRDTSKPFTIKLHGNEALIRSNLYLMVPGYGDSAFYIFHNHQTPGTVVNLNGFNIGHMDTIFFMYAVSSHGQDPFLWRTWANNRRYSGPNRRLGDGPAQGAPVGGWANTDRFSANTINMGILPNNSFANYRRWSVAGWKQQPDGLGGRTRTDTVAFAFEDLSPGDADFDDIVFYLTGVFLNNPPTIDTLLLSAQPARATIPAGDSVVYTATVILDSTDRFGTHHSTRRPEYDAQVTWQVTGPGATPSSLRYGRGPGATNTFYGLIAGATYIVTATFTDPATGKTTSTSMTITVTVGPPDKVSIESSPDGNGQEVTSRTLSTTQNTREDFYAVVRDRFNNYIGPASPVVWSSTPGGVVNATTGTAPAQGQGRIARLGSGETTVRVSYSYSARTLTDEMAVRVDNITYSQIRIGVREQNHFFQIDTLRMQTIQDTTLYLQGLQSIPGGQWVDIEGTWSATELLGLTSPGAPTSSWLINPDRKATGSITASTNTTPNGAAISDDIYVEFTRGLPYDIRFFSALGDYRTQQEIIGGFTLTAGQSAPVVAKLFDIDGIWLDEYESDPTRSVRLSWTVAPSSATATPSTGALTSFSSTVAHKTYTLKATYSYEGQVVTDSLIVPVVPAAPTQLVIEATPGRFDSPNAPNPYGTISITSDETTKHAYAVLRDEYGNWVRLSSQTLWASTNTAIALASVAVADSGKGAVTRVDNGDTFADATDIPTGLKGIVAINILPYFFTELKVYVSGTPPNVVTIEQLTMNTNQDTTLYVMGRRSDNQQWEQAQANWEASPSLATSINSPGFAYTWLVSPTKPGSGWIRVTNGNATPDTVAVQFTPGPPTAVVFSITSPADSLIAGSPIRSRLVLSNKDGQYPADICLSTTFSDILKSSAPGDSGKVIVGAQTVPLDQPVQVCFTAGVATVDFILYSASPHQLVATLENGLRDTTGQFIVKAGPLSKLSIEDAAGNALDTVRINAVGGFAVFISRGYDFWGNPRGQESANWSSTGTIPDPARSNVSRMSIDGTTIVDDATGTIVATAVSNPAISDNVVVILEGPPTILEEAFTRDYNGNGLLDALELRFSKAVTIPASALGGFAVGNDNPGADFAVSSIIGANGTATDSIFVLTFAEKGGQPQTDWTPWITITGVNGISQIPTPNTYSATDGAGPVIWSVSKTVVDPNDLTQDVIRVVFSEDIIATGGADVDLGTSPDRLLVVYDYNTATATWSENQSILTGIDLLTKVERDKVLGTTAIEFTMSNGADLLTRYWVKIDSTSLLITDKTSGISPNENNQKVRVVLVGTIDKVRPGPNPTTPIFTRVGAGTFEAVHYPDARRWVRNDQRGTVLSFSLTVPPDDPNSDNDVIAVHVKIYDIAGNLVHTTFNPDLAPQLRRLYPNADNVPVDLYWNGSNAQGMAVASGIYRVVVYVDYKDDTNFTDLRDVVTVGIGR